MGHHLVQWFENEKLDENGFPDRELNESEKWEIAFAAINRYYATDKQKPILGDWFPITLSIVFWLLIVWLSS